MTLRQQDETQSFQGEELLSSLMDNEYAERPADELVEKMVGDDNLLNKWESYHLIRDVLQTNEANLGSAAQKVSSRLQSEPCISGMLGCETKASKNWNFDWRQWWRPAVGLAFASTAFIFVGQLVYQDNTLSTQSMIAQEKSTEAPKVLLTDALPLASERNAPNTLVRERFIEHQYAIPLRNTSKAKLVGYDPNAQ